MQNSSNERPTLPSIWDLFENELSLEPTGRYNVRTPSSSVHTLPSDQDRRYNEWANRRAYQDHPSDPGFGGPFSLGETPHQVPDAPSIPLPYHLQEIHGDPNSLHHNLGTNPHRTSTPTPSTDNPGGSLRTIHLTSSPGIQPTETNPGAHYDRFRFIQPVDPRDESAKHECQYCGKAFVRPSTLRIHLNSHTGEKPFVCPNEDCGRGFSVLSNMRRHARIHAQPTTRQGSAHAQQNYNDTSPFDDYE